MRTLYLIAVCWSILAAVNVPKAVAANVAVAPEVAASPLPPASGAPSHAKLAPVSNRTWKAPHLFSAGRKSLPTYGYMKQTSDDRDGLSRLQDQARQLRPPR